MQLFPRAVVLAAAAASVACGSSPSGTAGSDSGLTDSSTDGSPMDSSADTAPSGDGGDAGALLGPGEICTDPSLAQVAVRAMPPTVFLPTCAGDAASCTTRQVRVVVDPDACAVSTLSFATANAAVMTAPAPQAFHVHHNEATLTLTGGAQTGHTQITVFADVHGASGSIGNTCQSATDCTGAGDQCHGGVCVAATTIDVYVGSQPGGTFPMYCGTPQTPASASVGALAAGQTLTLPTGIASIGLPPGAGAPNQGSYLWSVSPFPASITCTQSLSISGYQALGPAITFGPGATSFAREVPLSIPIDPSGMPSSARLRHLRVAYSGPSFKSPRVVPVTDLRIVPVATTGSCTTDADCAQTYAPSTCDTAVHVCDQWQLSFKAPRLGTYQAVIAMDAGAAPSPRSLSHRAVLGLSMGAGGAASFGLRHHDLVDVLAPLGGAADWTWMSSFVERDLFGGFRSIPSGTTLADIPLTSTPCSTGADCKADETCLGVLTSPPAMGQCVLLPKETDPYVHAETFNTWWYEYPDPGSSGAFSRSTYVQFLRDVSLAFGDPISDNLAAGGTTLPAGVPVNDPSVVGGAGNCAVTVDPVCPIAQAAMPWPSAQTVDAGSIPPSSCPELASLQPAWSSCGADRCAHALTLQGYYDGRYNPDGIFPVITVCDGTAQSPPLSPYAATWSGSGAGTPLELGLAVDYNGNGVRDQLEPILVQGHEPFSDFGVDGVPDPSEPGYSLGVNDDPAGDDYDPLYNPTGTENDRRYEVGEPYQDYGLDGVAGTPQQPSSGWAHPGDGYDVGQGDGVFTVTPGLQNLWNRDPHSILRQSVGAANIPAGPVDAVALARLDCWIDGGLRDLLDAHVDARHLLGAWAGRGRLATTLTGFSQAPDLDPVGPFDPRHVDFSDLPGVVLQRYGAIDPSATDVSDGSGQDLGTAAELTARLQASLYFIASRWADHPELRWRVQPSSANPASSAAACEIAGTCTLAFTSTTGRVGPVTVVLPPGYANAGLQSIRYPVVYAFHGYQQGAAGLMTALSQLDTWWNDPLSSGSSRLAKAIVVLVDGRCRPNADGSSECLHGSFFTDSPRAGGAQDEQWILDLIKYIDGNYRTLGPSSVSWTE